MKEIPIDELKKVQLEILKKVHRFCEAKGLRYFLGYGTLIGAIRHRGYIPWDDDIDIIMLREDYEVFINSFNGAFDELEVISPELNIDYYAPYANVINKKTILKEVATFHRGFELGVKIDVFPFDSVPFDTIKYSSFIEQLVALNDVLRFKRRRVLKCQGLNNKLRVLYNKVLNSCVSYREVQQKIMKMVENERDDNSTFVDCAVFPAYKTKRFERRLLDTTIKVEFEGNFFYAPGGYDSILRIIYGDYMQLPPKEKQIAHHGFKAYWKD